MTGQPTPLPRRLIDTVPGLPADAGTWAWALADQRRHTLRAIDGLDPAHLEWTPPGVPNAIGTLLYHITATQVSWLYMDILETGVPDDVMARLPWPYHDDAGHLHPAPGETLDGHRARLAAIQQRLLDAVAALTPDDFLRERQLPQYVVTPQWTLYHLMRHEAHHTGQIRLLRAMAEHR